MSDQNPGGSDFRATDKRKDETVMVSADDLSNLVADARQVPPTAPVVPAPAAPSASPTASAPNRTMLLVLVVVAVLVVVGLVAFLVL